MNREIKFRAWHKTEQKMCRVLSLVFPQREQATATLMPNVGPYITCPLDEVELLEYTGLKDRNRTPICEGDIVRHVTDRFPGVVFFDRGCFWVREYLSQTDLALRGYSSQTDAALSHDIEKETRWSIDLDWEIIGNQYEHPHLIQIQVKL